MSENEIGTIIVDSAVDLHRNLGPGLLETVYEVTLARALERRGLAVQRQVSVPIEYQGETFSEGFRRSHRRGSGHRGTEINRARGASPQEATIDLPPPHWPQTRLSFEFRRSAHARWNHPNHQRPPFYLTSVSWCLRERKISSNKLMNPPPKILDCEISLAGSGKIEP